MYAYIEASGKQEGDVAYLESTVNIPGKELMPKYMSSVKTGGVIVLIESTQDLTSKVECYLIHQQKIFIIFLTYFVLPQQ